MPYLSVIPFWPCLEGYLEVAYFGVGCCDVSVESFTARLALWQNEQDGESPKAPLFCRLEAVGETSECT